MSRILCFLFLFFQITLLSAQRILLNEGWEFYDEKSGTWLPAKVPGNIHQDLFLNGKITHPFSGTNEDSVQWIGKEDWNYRLKFSLPDSMRSAKKISIYFESLDTYCQIDLDAMSEPKPVTDDLFPHEIEPAPVTGNMFLPFRMDVSDFLRRSEDNTLMLTFTTTLRGFFLIDDEYLVSETAGNDASKDKFSPFVRKAPYHFGWDWGPRLITQGIRGNVWLEADMPEEEPESSTLHQVELVREKDSIGESYFFRIDGKAVFMKGANYIPQDEYFPANRHERIRELLLSAKESGFNMIRVWGGGIYEEEFFYDLCDSLGIYVWQDFMFACSMYSAGAEFRHSVKQEAEAQVKRLRHHPSIILWCGNNEIEVAWKNWGWQHAIGIHDEDSVKMWHNYLYLFDTLLRSVVSEFDPGTPYISTSPLSNWGSPERFNSGDNHYWGVWHGEEPFENFRSNVPRFMSEYGFQSFPDYELMQVWDAPTDTSIFKWHQKSYKGSRMIAQYAEEWFGESHNIQEQIRKGQFAQAEAYRIAIGSHRAAQPRCMGTLYWQLNDCWPGPSWSSMDYVLNWKPLQYLVKRMYSDHLLVPLVEEDKIKVYFSNQDQDAGKGLLTVQLKNFRGKVMNLWKDEVSWEANTSQVLTQIPFEKWVPQKHPRGVYLVASLEGAGVKTKELLFFEKPAELRLPAKPGISITEFEQTSAGGTLKIKAEKFAKGVWLEIPERDEEGKLFFRFSDNYFDMEAGEEKTIHVIPTGEVQLGDVPHFVFRTVN